MKAGKAIIIEIGKRGLKRKFFSKEQYKQLKNIEDFNEAKTKICQYGYPYTVVSDANNPKEIVDKLKTIEQWGEREGCIAHLAMETIFFFILSLMTCS